MRWRNLFDGGCNCCCERAAAAVAAAAEQADAAAEQADAAAVQNWQHHLEECVKIRPQVQHIVQ